MIKLIARLIRPIVEEANRQTHRRRYAEAKANGANGLEGVIFTAFGADLSEPYASFIRPASRAGGRGRGGAEPVRVPLHGKRRGRQFSRFVSFQCFAARRIFAPAADRMRLSRARPRGREPIFSLRAKS